MAFFAALMISSACQGGEIVAMTREEVVRDLSNCIGIDDDAESFDKYKALLNKGEATYPGLAEELQQTKDSMMVGAITAVFVQSKGDKRIPLRAMTKYLEIHANDVPIVGVDDIVIALGSLGGPKEADVLRDLLSRKDGQGRDAAESSLKKIEERQRAEARRANPPARIDGRGGKDVPHVPANEGQTNRERSDSVTLLCSNWQWIIGGMLVFIAYLIFRRSAGNPPVK